MRKIVWSDKAQKEFDRIYKYWVKHNQSDLYSEKLLDETLRIIKIVSENPEIGEKLKLKRFANYRRGLVLENFSVIYRSYETKIVVSAFFDNRRDPEEMKL